MSLPRPVRLYQFHAYLIWWDDPFKSSHWNSHQNSNARPTIQGNKVQNKHIQYMRALVVLVMNGISRVFFQQKNMRMWGREDEKKNF